MLSIRINVDTYLLVKSLLTLQFLHFHSFDGYLIIIHIYVSYFFTGICFLDFIEVTTHIGPVEATRTTCKFTKTCDIWLLIE
jgi:hypothetical protein